MNREQIQIIHGLKGERNANRFLNDMSEYLSSFRHGMEKVYYLNKEGRERIGSEVVRKKTPNIQHYLLRNQLWIHYGFPHSWENEVKITVKDISLVCDAKFYLKDKTLAIVEVDVEQSMVKNRAKMDKYRKIKELTGNDFHLIWVTETENKKVKLRGLMKGMTGEVYSIKDIR